jgi:hypothetical protein
MSFSEGFQGGWGLADSYLNRQDARKRQAAQDERQRRVDLQTQSNWQATYNLNKDKNDALIARNKIIDARDLKKDTLTLEKGNLDLDQAKIKAAKEKKQRDLSDQFQAGRANGYFTGHAENNTFRFNTSPESLDWLENTGLIPNWKEFGNKPQKVLRDYGIVESAIANGKIDEETLPSFNRIVGKLLSQRGSKITNPEATVMVDGKPKPATGWDIVNRKVVNATPNTDKNGKQGLAMEFEVTVVDPETGKKHTYLAPATEGGSDLPGASVSTIAPSEILSLIGIQRTAMQDIARDPKFTEMFSPMRDADVLERPKIYDKARKDAETNTARIEANAKVLEKQIEKVTAETKKITAEGKSYGVKEEARIKASKYFDDFAENNLGKLIEKGYPNVMRSSFHLSMNKWKTKIAKELGVETRDLVLNEEFRTIYKNAISSAFSKYQRGGKSSYKDNSLLDGFFYTLYKGDTDLPPGGVVTGGDEGLGGAASKPKPKPTMEEIRLRERSKLQGNNALERLRVERGTVDVHNKT